MRLLLRGVFVPLAIVAIVALAVSAATAQEAPTLPSVPLSERIPAAGRTTPDSVHEVSSTPVPDGLEGGTCDVVVTGANNGSVHPGSDILVTSANTVTIADVESEAGRSNIPADAPLQLGDTVTISVRLGADGLFSGGTLAVTFDCTPPPPPTTTTTAPPVTTTTKPPATTVPPKCVDKPETAENDCVPTLPHTGGESLPGALLGVAAIGAGFGLVKAASKGLTR